MHGGLSFDQKTLMGKKLSFDTTELLDEQARRYFRQYKKISIDSTSPDDAEKKEFFCSESPKLEERRFSVVSPVHEDRRHNRSPNLGERRSSLMSPNGSEKRTIYFSTTSNVEGKNEEKSSNNERLSMSKNEKSVPQLCSPKLEGKSLSQSLSSKSDRRASNLEERKMKTEERFQTCALSNFKEKDNVKVDKRNLVTRNGQEESSYSNKTVVSRPCETFVIKQNNISAIMTDVCENSIIKTDDKNEDSRLSSEEEEDHESEEINKINVSKKKEKIPENEIISNSCKLDKISVDQSNKLVSNY